MREPTMNQAAVIPSIPNPRLFSSDADATSKSGESSIRPRNRRLISTEQELVSTSATSTPGGSRAVSPIPSKHPLRNETLDGNNRTARPVGGLVVPGNKGGRSSPQRFGGLWEGGWTNSWTTLQGLASSVLSVDTDGEGEGTSNIGSPPRRGKKKESWGPTGLPKKGEDAIGVGSAAEREAAVRARRMRGVLEGRDEDLNVQKDISGNYKRRTSAEENRPGSADEGIEDALVYIHQVQPQDTLAGVILKYNCQPAVFRKANRFWPNDSIQTRKVVVIPVDASTIRGRPCEPPTSGYQEADLLAPTPLVEEPSSPNGLWSGESSSQNDMSAERTELEDHPWTHVRWVLIEYSPSSKPVEIARMPRKTLGYFPPRRRKSQNTISTVSTPRGSFEVPFAAQSSPGNIGSTSSTPSRRSSNLGPHPSQILSGSYFPPATSSTRPRRGSVGEAADRLGWMRGPGGVGTLGKNVRKPGPGQDGLNAWAKKHMPGLTIDSLPSTSLIGGESAHFGFSDELASIAEGPAHTAGSRSATPSNIGQGLGIENAAAAIEGWVRRLAVKVPGTPKLGGSRIEASDLIELLDGAGSDDGRGFEPLPGSMRTSTQELNNIGREDLEGVTKGKPAASAKGGKND
jgi:hypothetical protein